LSASAGSRLGTRQVYGLQAMLGIAGLAATVAVVGAAASSVHIAPHSGHRLVVASQDFTYPAVNVAAGILLALAALGAGIIIVALRAGWRQVRATRAFLRDLHVIGPLASHPTVYVIDDVSPQAFCAGYMRPRVYVSTRALALLSESELRTVLAHEYHHRDMRDPLRLACGRILSDALFFMPVMRRLHDRYCDLAELTADAAALHATNGETAPLASALLALGTQDSENVVGISPERVDSLLGLPRTWRLPSLLVIAALATIATLVALVWRTSQAASAHTTFNLPIVASQPCILVLGLVPMLACAAAITSRRHAARPAPRQVTKNR
jgi:beta-lactamase regulating signal transducer with metallopeptidase domain